MKLTTKIFRLQRMMMMMVVFLMLWMTVILQVVDGSRIITSQIQQPKKKSATRHHHHSGRSVASSSSGSNHHHRSGSPVLSLPSQRRSTSSSSSSSSSSLPQKRSLSSSSLSPPPPTATATKSSSLLPKLPPPPQTILLLLIFSVLSYVLYDVRHIWLPFFNKELIQQKVVTTLQQIMNSPSASSLTNNVEDASLSTVSRLWRQWCPPQYRPVLIYTCGMAVWEFLGLTTIPVETAAGLIFPSYTTAVLTSLTGKLLGATTAFFFGRVALQQSIPKLAIIRNNPIFQILLSNNNNNNNNKATKLTQSNASSFRTAFCMKFSCFPEFIKNFGSSCISTITIWNFIAVTLLHGGFYTIIWTYLGYDTARHVADPNLLPNPFVPYIVATAMITGCVVTPLVMAWWIRDLQRHAAASSSSSSMQLRPTILLTKMTQATTPWIVKCQSSLQNLVPRPPQLDPLVLCYKSTQQCFYQQLSYLNAYLQMTSYQWHTQRIKGLQQQLKTTKLKLQQQQEQLQHQKQTIRRQQQHQTTHGPVAVPTKPSVLQSHSLSSSSTSTSKTTPSSSSSFPLSLIRDRSLAELWMILLIVLFLLSS